MTDFFGINVIGDLSLAEIFVNLTNLYNARILKINKVESFRGQQSEIRPPAQMLLELGGAPGRGVTSDC